MLLSGWLCSHGPHTWGMPIPTSDSALSLLTNGDGAASLPHLSEVSEPVSASTASGGGGGGGGGTQQRLRQRRRVPLPREAVAELRAMLKKDRYPQPEVREALARRHGLERRRVDRWLENARARETAGGAMLKSEPGSS